MYSISIELKDKITHINKILLDKYKDILPLDKEYLREFINKNIGLTTKLQKLSKEEMSNYMKRGGILGVDGSKNRMGGAYPHFIEIYQGLAMSTLHKDNPIYKTDFYTPLVSQDEKENPLENTIEDEEDIMSKKLSSIEVEAAIEGIKELEPYAVIMDGSLIRYDIECFDKWMELRKECEERDIILIGVIKDIKTSIIGDLLMEDKSLSIDESLYDRELLYGLLEYGETILIQRMTKKSEEGFSSLFMRSADAPNVIGMDILDSQKQHLEEMARLVFTLTPKDGRGVPLWLDIVDSEVKIPDKMIRSLLESYLNREILEMFFVSERDKRTM